MYQCSLVTMYQCLKQTHCLHTWAWIEKQCTPPTKCYLCTHQTIQWLNFFKMSHHFRLAQQWLAFRFSGMWHSITRSSVSQHFKVTQCLHLQRPFWRHSNTSQKIWNLSQNCNKQTLNMTYGWHMFGILSPIKRHEGNGPTSTTTFFA